mgnify:CR=1 FL=1
MSEATGEDKTEEPTAKRLEQARENGDVVLVVEEVRLRVVHAEQAQDRAVDLLDGQLRQPAAQLFAELGAEVVVSQGHRHDERDTALPMLFDEAEELVQRALGKALQGRTSIVIAHRLSTIMAADQILVLENGHIVERGRHEELIARSGLYSELFARQDLTTANE